MATKQIGNIRRAALTNTAHMNLSTELYDRIVVTTPAALNIEKLAPLYKEALDNEGFSAWASYLPESH